MIRLWENVSAKSICIKLVTGWPIYIKAITIRATSITCFAYAVFFFCLIYFIFPVEMFELCERYMLNVVCV